VSDPIKVVMEEVLRSGSLPGSLVSIGHRGSRRLFLPRSFFARIARISYVRIKVFGITAMRRACPM
jgi:hypothetical protein